MQSSSPFAGMITDKNDNAAASGRRGEFGGSEFAVFAFVVSSAMGALPPVCTGSSRTTFHPSIPATDGFVRHASSDLPESSPCFVAVAIRIRPLRASSPSLAKECQKDAVSDRSLRHEFQTGRRTIL